MVSLHGHLAISLEKSDNIHMLHRVVVFNGLSQKMISHRINIHVVSYQDETRSTAHNPVPITNINTLFAVDPV